MQTLPEDTCLVFWPETFANEWCGEFAPRDPPPPGPPAAARARDPVGRWGQDLSDHSDEVDYLKGLSTRASGALRRSGIRRVSQLLTWDVAGLLDLPDFGPHSLAQVVAALAARGLALRGEAPSVDTRPPVRPQ
jgi:DNA-directed RNA polymerase alpha subunit